MLGEGHELVRAELLVSTTPPQCVFTFDGRFRAGRCHRASGIRRRSSRRASARTGTLSVLSAATTSLRIAARVGDRASSGPTQMPS